MKIDVRAELERYEWSGANWSADKLQARSPFRDESRPSFYVWLEDTSHARAGDWQDSGNYDDEYKKGGIVKLLAYLRKENEQETWSYLVSKYGEGVFTAEEVLKLKVRPEFYEERQTTMNKGRLSELKFRHPYLGRRGISEEVQREARIGYDKEMKAVSIPWFDAKGRLLTIKYRTTIGKKFWYDPEGVDITRHLWGMNHVYNKRPETVYLVEAEIDALYIMTYGHVAVATGNKFFTRQRADLLRKAPGIRNVVLGMDNDEAGQEMRRQAESLLQGHVRLREWKLPENVKDINDIREGEHVVQVLNNTLPIPIIRY
jgi:5S rRNA maturation endonuclease (ribonuclease M5)